jgi:hypothetical protein
MTLMAGAANASAIDSQGDHGPPVIAVTQVTNQGTVTGYGGNWASDSITRTATVSGGTAVAPSYCGHTTGPCYSYTAQVLDLGSFTATSGALTPNQVTPGKTIKSAVRGYLSGYAPFSFYATGTPEASLVPRTYDNAPYLTDWPELFFPYGTTFAGVTGLPFSFVYGALTPCGLQIWNESSSNDYGNLATDGNIVGCS